MVTVVQERLVEVEAEEEGAACGRAAGWRGEDVPGVYA